MRTLPSHREAGTTRELGQAMVEFAIVLPVLALLLVMAIDFGRVFFGWVALHNATRIAADFGAAHVESWSTHQDRYRTLVRGDLEAINCFPDDGTWDDADIPDPEFPDGTTSGSRAVVTLECEFELITPLAASILGGTVSVGSESTFPIHKALQQPLPPNAQPEPTESVSASPTASPTSCQAPVADFTWSPNRPTKEQPALFTDTSSIGTCTVIAWNWDFDDGATSSEQHPTHTYTWNGNNSPRFDVVLTITTTGGIDSVTHRVSADP